MNGPPLLAPPPPLSLQKKYPNAHFLSLKARCLASWKKIAARIFSSHQPVEFAWSLHHFSTGLCLVDRRGILSGGSQGRFAGPKMVERKEVEILKSNETNIYQRV